MLSVSSLNALLFPPQAASAKTIMEDSAITANFLNVFFMVLSFP
jgi:hypothetical protein